MADVNFAVEVASMEDYRALDISASGASLYAAPPCTAVSMKNGHVRKFGVCLEQWCVFLAQAG